MVSREFYSRTGARWHRHPSNGPVSVTATASRRQQVQLAHTLTSKINKVNAVPFPSISTTEYIEYNINQQ
jgi:hypothetical protein